MTSQEKILKFIKQQLAREYNLATIRANLLLSGWRPAEIDPILKQFVRPNLLQPKIIKLKHVKPLPIKNIPSTKIKINYLEWAKNVWQKYFPAQKSKLLLIGAVFIIIIVFLFGFASADIIIQNPETQVAKIITNLTNTKNLSYTLEIKGNLTDYQPTLVGNLNSLISGVPSASFVPTSNPPISFDLKIAGRRQDHTDIPLNSIQAILAYRQSDKIILDAIAQAPKIYLRLENAPNNNYLAVDKIKNQWIAFDTAGAAINQQTGNQNFQALTTFLKQKKPISFQSVGIETINNIKTKHYQINLATNFNALFPDLVKSLGEAASDGQIKKWQTFLTSSQITNISVWVDENNNFLKKLQLDLTTKNFQNSGAGGTINIAMTFDNKQTFNIVPPIDSKPFSSVANILSPISQGLNISIKDLPPLPELDVTTDSDNDGLPDVLENVYGTDPHNSDTDADGFKDGDEIRNGFNPRGDGKLK